MLVLPIAFQRLRNWTVVFGRDRIAAVMLKSFCTSIVGQSKEVNFPVPWGHISAKVWGNPTGKPVLALHGWLDNAGSFDKLIPLLSEEFYIVVIDWPGHGNSSHRPRGMHYDAYNYIADIKYVVDALEWDKFSFLAHSMGGGAASWFAGALPDRVEAAVLIESYGFWTEPMDDLPKLMGRSLNTITSLQDINNKVYPTWDAVVDRMLEGHIQQDSEFSREAAITLCKRGTKRVDSDAGFSGYQFTRDLRAKAPSLLKVARELDSVFLKSIQCPLLVIVGEFSSLSSTFREKMVASAHAKMDVVTVSGNHHMHLTQPESIYKLVDCFLLHNKVNPNFSKLTI